MDLIQVKKYLQERRAVTLKDVSTHFNQNADTVRPLLDTWVGKGKVKRVVGKSCGKGCCQCDPDTLEVYEWIGASIEGEGKFVDRKSVV